MDIKLIEIQKKIRRKDKLTEKDIEYLETTKENRISLFICYIVKHLG